MMIVMKDKVGRDKMVIGSQTVSASQQARMVFVRCYSYDGSSITSNPSRINRPFLTRINNVYILC